MIQWYPGHMAKAIREISDKIKIVDLVIILLDARCPRSSFNPLLSDVLKNKKCLYVLTKKDKADIKETKQWLAYFQKHHMKAIALDARDSKNDKIILKEAQDLMKEKREKDLSKGIKPRPIKTMIVGIPNVGKSTLINSLVGKRVTAVGDRPGITKVQQWIKINQNVELLDTPGVLWPKFENHDIALKLAYTGSIKDELINKEEIAYNLIKYLKNNNKNELFARYKLTDDDFNSIIPEDDEALELMNMIARKRGAIISGGEIDYEKVSAIILNDFRSGKIAKITLEKINE
mgnify:CR=1 FL=1